MFNSSKGVSRCVPIAVWSAPKSGLSTPASPRSPHRATSLEREDKSKPPKTCYVSSVGRLNDLAMLEHEAVKRYLGFERAIVAAEKGAEEKELGEDAGPGVYVKLHVQARTDRRKERRGCVHGKHNAQGNSIRRRTSAQRTSDPDTEEIAHSIRFDKTCASPSDEDHAARQLAAQFDDYASSNPTIPRLQACEAQIKTTHSIIQGPFDPNFMAELAAYQNQQATATAWQPRNESDMEEGRLIDKWMHGLRKTVTSAGSRITIHLVVALSS
jgi:hypothetical protein